MTDSRVSRRTLLGAAVTTTVVFGLGGALSGCEAEPPTPPATTQTPVDPLMPLLIGQQELQRHYERVLAAFPELGPAVTDLQAQTTAHTEALLAAVPVLAGQLAAANSGSTTSAGSSSPPAPPPPVDAASARVSLKAAVESAAASLRAAALLASGDLAALLGSCAASTTCHARMIA